MKGVSVDLILIYASACIMFKFLRVDGSSQTYLYEKMHNYGKGNRVIPNFRYFANHKEYPEPLPTSTRSPDALIRTPYKNLYQGSRRPNDTRVYRRRFNFEATRTGHQVFCEGMFDCIITHLAIETNSGIPILLRGGAGYRYFVVVTKAKAGDELKGMVRAYCLKSHHDYYKEHTSAPNHFRY